ncbi:unnamed protein product [Spodoptera exigua]|nr:unnamed protein product [Spodoptera exigua]
MARVPIIIRIITDSTCDGSMLWLYVGRYRDLFPLVDVVVYEGGSLQRSEFMTDIHNNTQEVHGRTSPSKVVLKLLISRQPTVSKGKLHAPSWKSDYSACALDTFRRNKTYVVYDSGVQTYLIGRSTMSMLRVALTYVCVSLSRTVKVVCLSYGIPMLPPPLRRLCGGRRVIDGKRSDGS